MTKRIADNTVDKIQQKKTKKRNSSSYLLHSCGYPFFAAGASAAALEASAY